MGRHSPRQRSVDDRRTAGDDVFHRQPPERRAANRVEPPIRPKRRTQLAERGIDDDQVAMDENRGLPAQFLFEAVHPPQKDGDLLRQPDVVLVGEHDVGGLAPLQKP